MDELAAVAALSDRQLVEGLERAARNERGSLADLLAHLVEFERRKLHEPHGYSSLFYYVTRRLGYSEDAAYKRIRAAHAAAKFPRILTLLRSGRLHLRAVVMLKPHLSDENQRELLDRVSGMTARELDFLVAGFEPQPARRDVIRRIEVLQPDPPRSSPAGCMPTADESLFPAETAALGPAPTSAQDGPKGAAAASRTAPGKADGRAPAPPSVPQSAVPSEIQAHAAPPSVPSVRISFDASREFYDRLERARGLLRHRYRDGSLEAVLGDALDALLERVDPDRRLARLSRRRKKAAPGAAQPRRRIPQVLRDAVWRRDGGRCAFVAPDGRRCAARELLEFDHVRPWARGGSSDDPANIRLLCRTHNLLLARAAFGRLAAPRTRRGRAAPGEAEGRAAS